MHCPGSALEPLDIIVAREPEGQTPSIGEKGWPCWPCTAPAPYCTFKHQGFPVQRRCWLTGQLWGEMMSAFSKWVPNNPHAVRSCWCRSWVIGMAILTGVFHIIPIAFALFVFSCSCSICISCIFFLSCIFSFFFHSFFLSSSLQALWIDKKTLRVNCKCSNVSMAVVFPSTFRPIR